MMNWQKVKLGDFLTARVDRFKPDDKEIIGLKRIDKIDFSGNIYLSEKISNTDMILVKKGDLIISGINVCKGAMSVYQGDSDVTATIHYSSYKFDPNRIDIEFLKYFLRSSKFKQTLIEQVSGGIKTEINPKHLLPLIVEIPSSVKEQRFLVNKLSNKTLQIDTLFSEQSHQFYLLKKIRQQVLTDAIQGRLTADWRKQNPKVESAVELLKRIKIEKKQLVIDKKIKKEKPLLAISEKEMAFELPKGWVWCRLGEILSFGPVNGYSPKESKKGKGIKCLTLTATTSGIFKKEHYKYVDELIPFDSYLWLVENDILLQRGNSIDYVGIAALYEGDTNKFIFPDLMIKIQVSMFLSSKYIHQVLNSPFNRKYYATNASGTQKSMPKINQGVVLNTLIPLPPLLEQQAIVEKVETLLEKCNLLQKEIEKQNNYSKDLLKAVFNETFGDRQGIYE